VPTLQVADRRRLSFTLDQIEVRDQGADGNGLTITGHAAVFDQLSEDLGGFREQIARGAFRSVLANTVAAFALGDYEWLLPMESDNLVDLVDMMRDLRATDARRHVRKEVPFYTGRRIPVTDIPEVLQ